MDIRPAMWPVALAHNSAPLTQTKSREDENLHKLQMIINKMFQQYGGNDVVDHISLWTVAERFYWYVQENQEYLDETYSMGLNLESGFLSVLVDWIDRHHKASLSPYQLWRVMHWYIQYSINVAAFPISAANDKERYNNWKNGHGN